MPRQVGKYTVVAFYDIKDPDGFGWMANTAKNYPVKIDDEVIWPTTEHYFQAQKFPDNEEYKKGILNYKKSFSKFPEFVKKLQEDLFAKGLLSYPNNDSKAYWDDWDNNRAPAVMRKAVRAKLDTHKELLEALLALDEKTIIVESTGNDSRWGDGGDGRGKNQLGRIFMEELVARREKLGLPVPTEPVNDRYEQFNAFRKRLQDRNLYNEIIYPIVQVQARAAVLTPFTEPVVAQKAFEPTATSMQSPNRTHCNFLASDSLTKIAKQSFRNADNALVTLDVDHTTVKGQQYATATVFKQKNAQSAREKCGEFKIERNRLTAKDIDSDTAKAMIIAYFSAMPTEKTLQITPHNAEIYQVFKSVLEAMVKEKSLLEGKVCKIKSIDHLPDYSVQPDNVSENRRSKGP